MAGVDLGRLQAYRQLGSALHTAGQPSRLQLQGLGEAGIANVINITGVERIILGGTIYHELQDDLLPIIEKNAVKYAIGNGMDGVDILLNELGDEAPALGASMLD